MWQRWMNVHKIVLATVLPILRLLPLRWSHWLLGLMGRLDLRLVPGQTRLYEDAVADGARRIGADWDVRAVSRGLARQTYRWRVRDVLLGDLPDDRWDAVFTVTGRDELDAALAAGNGVILLGNHFGAHVAIVHWMFRQGYPFHWFGERPRSVSNYLARRLEAPAQSALFVSHRSAEGGAALRTARDLLNEGKVVVFASDVRWPSGKVAPMTFLGRSETVATSWVHLAARTGAAVVPVFCRWDESARYHLDFHPPVHIQRADLHNGQAARQVQAALDTLTDQVRRHPEHSNDYFFWEPPLPRDPAAAHVRPATTTAHDTRGSHAA